MADESDQLRDGEWDTLRFTFGMMEARLARIHEIASDKRTQFQARLRNFQRLPARPIPAGVKAGRGKTVFYSPGQVVEVALALELTQLGLLPERIEDVFRNNRFPIFMALTMAAGELIEKGGFRPDRERKQSDENLPIMHGKWGMDLTEDTDPLSMFLYFDPSVLDMLTPYADDEAAASATFFYGGAGIVRENIVRWTAGPYIRRISLINVTAMLWSLVVRSKPENQKLFLKGVVEWAEQMGEEYLSDTVPESDEEPAAPVAEGVDSDVAIGWGNASTEVTLGDLERLQADLTPQQLEDEIVRRAATGGTPEYVMRAALESSRPDRERRVAELAAGKDGPGMPAREASDEEEAAFIRRILRGGTPEYMVRSMVDPRLHWVIDEVVGKRSQEGTDDGDRN